MFEVTVSSYLLVYTVCSVELLIYCRFFYFLKCENYCSLYSKRCSFKCQTHYLNLVLFEMKKVLISKYFMLDRLLTGFYLCRNLFRS